jgi:hypothetical protein
MGARQQGDVLEVEEAANQEQDRVSDRAVGCAECI